MLRRAEIARRREPRFPDPRFTGEEQFEQSGRYDVPVEQPTKFEFITNLEIAKANRYRNSDDTAVARRPGLRANPSTRLTLGNCASWAW
jgi:hypothetical protein